MNRKKSGSDWFERKKGIIKKKAVCVCVCVCIAQAKSEKKPI